MVKSLIYSFLLGFCSILYAQDRSTKDLAFLVGDWKMKMTFSPETDEPRILDGAMECQWTMDSTFIRCEYLMKRSGKKDALNDVYFNFNSVTNTYESLWFSSTWPVKVLLGGDLKKVGSEWILETTAEFPIADGVVENVKDVLVFEEGSNEFERKTFIKTSKETEWKYHSKEDAIKVKIEQLANEEQISGKTWQAVGPGLTNAIRATSQIYISDRLADQYELDKKIIQNFLKYTLSYTSNQLSADKVIYRYPHYNEAAVNKDLKELEQLGLLELRDTLYSITSGSKQIIDDYWDLRLAQTRYFDYVSDDRLQALYTVMDKIVKRARKLDDSYPNQSVLNRFHSRSSQFEDYPLSVKVSELLREFTAFINDVSHYKYVQFPQQTQDERFKDLNLSPLAMELMSATRNSRVYKLQRCYVQPNWRQGVSGCDKAVDELIAGGLVRKEDGTIQQTQLGSELSKAAEAFADERRYQAWQDVTVLEYLEFKEVLDWILENPVEAFVPYPERYRRLVQSIGFSPNQDILYFTLPHREYLESQGHEVTEEIPRLVIYYAIKTKSGWGDPKLIDFGAEHKVYEPTLSPDGQLMLFNSNRQLDGSPVEDRAPNNLWYSQKKNGKWQAPKYLVNINTKENEESYATLTNEGDLFYVRGSELNGETVFTIYSTRFKGEKTKKGKPIGLGYAIGDPWVAPDGSYIIYTKFDPKDWVNTCDLHYSFRDGNGWTEPRKMPRINGKRSDYAVAITPDEEWIFYRRRGRFLKFPFQPILEEMKANKEP